jgi:Flp pilus assembly protein TadD
VNSRDPRPTPALPSFDPAQLSFGDVEAVPQLRVDRQGEGTGGANESAMAFREPPVCGESSYDDVVDAGLSWSVRIVQEAESAPAAPRPRPAPKPAVADHRPGDLTRPAAARAAGSMRTTGNHTTPESPAAAKRPAPVAIPSAALDPLKRSTEMSPRDAEAAIAYSFALEKHGNASAALEALDQCLAAGGDELRLICARAFLLGSRLKYDLAEAELKRAAKLRIDDPEVQLQVGILACRRARWRDAVEPLQKAAAQRTDDALAHFYLGEALNHVDQLTPALRAYEHATQLDPANWRAFKGVGIVLDRLGRPADAAVAYRHMREAQGR